MIFSILSDPILILFMIPTLLIALPVHEYFHAYAATKLGDPTPQSLGRLSLNPMRHLDPIGAVSLLLLGFGWAKPVPINSRYFAHPKRDMALVAAAGPLSNLLMSLIGGFLYLGCYRISYIIAAGSGVALSVKFFYYLSYFFYVFHYVNITLSIFNLIPLSPLDGSHLLSLILPAKANYWISRHQKQLYLGLMAWLLLGSFAYRFLLRISLIGGNAVLRNLVRILSLSGFISDLASWISRGILTLFSFIPFL